LERRRPVQRRHAVEQGARLGADEQGGDNDNSMA